MKKIGRIIDFSLNTSNHAVRYGDNPGDVDIVYIGETELRRGTEVYWWPDRWQVVPPPEATAVEESV